MSETLLRATESVCPECLQRVPARLVEEGGCVYLRRTCSRHGAAQCLLSEHAWYYAALDRYFFSVADSSAPPQRDYLVRMTERCNLQCPICLAAASPKDRPPPVPDLDLNCLEAFLDRRPRGRLKIDLISAEPTLREDLPEVIRAVKRRGHIVALHTNGIRLADPGYCRRLREAGCDEVHLQMDGFDDEAYLKIRGARLTRNKLRVLANLEEIGFPTDLVMVIMPNTNEDEIPRVLEYCRDRPFIRELFFLGTRALGNFRGAAELLMPDQVIDLVEERTGGLCDRRAVFRFQKLYFALLWLLGVRKCLYVQHYLLIRRPGRGWVPIADLFDWDELERVLDDLPRVRRGSWLQRAWWIVRLATALASPRALPYAADFLALLVRLKTGWALKRLPGRVLVLGYITACDPLNIDYQVAEHCGKGELSVDVGLHESGAHANIERERLWQGWSGRRPPAPPEGCR